MADFDIRGNVLRGNHVEASNTPEFWSVYCREPDGCWCWLADFDTRAAAERYTGGRHG